MRILTLAGFLLALSGCALMMEPDFVKDIRRSKKEFASRFPNGTVSYPCGERTCTAAVRESGKPIQIIFVHGSPGSWEAWAHFLLSDDLASKYDMIAINRFGFGSGERNKAEPSLDEQIKPLEHFITRNPGEKIILVGHSYGGPVILKAAVHWPQQVDGLIVVAGSVSAEHEKHKWYNEVASWKIARWMIPNDLLTANDEIYPLKEQLLVLNNDLDRIRAPTIVIHGHKDDLVDFKNAEYLVKKLGPKTARLIEHPTMNHFIPWHYSQFILQAIDNMAQNLR